MKTALRLTIATSLTVFLFAGISAQAQQPTEKEIKKAFQPKGTYKAPFKKASQVSLASVNLQFKLATRQEVEKRGVGNVITWGFLEGIDDQFLQEICNEYYKKLVAKLKENGYALSDEYLKSKSYQKLVDNNADNGRETEKKNWGIARIFTANNAPYIEYPTGMMGAHSGLGNEMKFPVGQLFITIDFIDIDQNINRGVTDLWGYRTDKFETNIAPVIRIEGVTSQSLGKQFKGDGTYAKFSGDNWSFCNAILGQYSIVSDVNYMAEIDKSKGMPESMKKFKSALTGDLVSIFSRGAVKSGRGVAENTFNIYANPASYKLAVLNALDKYNEYLMSYIKSNN